MHHLLEVYLFVQKSDTKTTFNIIWEGLQKANVCICITEQSIHTGKVNYTLGYSDYILVINCVRKVNKVGKGNALTLLKLCPSGMTNKL